MATVRRLLVLHTGALGDCVLAIHLARMMRRSWGEPEVTVAARSPIARWAATHGFVDQAVSLERVGGHRLYDAVLTLPKEAVDFAGRFDRVVSLLGGPAAPVSQRLANLLDADLIAVDPVPDAEICCAGAHITMQWVNAIERQGFLLPWSENQLATGLPRGRATAARRPRGEDAGGEVLIHPGSGGLNKCCPQEALETLAGDAIHAGWHVRWLIGPDEMERFGEAYADRLRIVAPVVFEPSVETAAEVVASAEAYIGNDAGMTHVAALAGVATVALFGPTDPRVWRPLGFTCRVASFPASDESRAAWSRRILGLLVPPPR